MGSVSNLRGQADRGLPTGYLGTGQWDHGLGLGQRGLGQRGLGFDQWDQRMSQQQRQRDMF